MKSRHGILLFLFLLCICVLQGGPALADQPVLQGIYEIAALQDPGFIVDVKSCTFSEEAGESGASLQMYRPLEVNQQKFYLDQVADSRFRISSLASGLFLTASPGEDPASSEGESLLQTVLGTISMEEDASGENGEIPASQIWLIRKNQDGSLAIRSALGGTLTQENSRPCLGASLTLRPYTGSAGQSWLLLETEISPQAYADTDLINPFAEDGPYENCSLSMWFGNEKETLSAEEIASWITETEEHSLTDPSESFIAYAQSLADRYNTQGHPRNFRTSYGNTITLYEGNFGWALDVEATARALLEAARSDSACFVLPVWSQKGASLSRGDDIGDSYIEVDLANQKVWLYKNGKQLVETDCVSGTYGTDRQTPGGVYSIFYMQSPAVLRGADYVSPVDYWMAFNGNIGLHDADWRDSFGGDIFQTNGSHGCVNLPIPAAKKIYENISIGYPVVCYS